MEKRARHARMSGQWAAAARATDWPGSPAFRECPRASAADVFELVAHCADTAAGAPVHRYANIIVRGYGNVQMRAHPRAISQAAGEIIALCSWRSGASGRKRLREGEREREMEQRWCRTRGGSCTVGQSLLSKGVRATIDKRGWRRGARSTRSFLADARLPATSISERLGISWECFWLGFVWWVWEWMKSYVCFEYLW